MGKYNDPVERQDVIDATVGFFIDYCGEEVFDEEFRNGLIEVLDVLPSADPDRKTGKWIVDEKRFGHTERHCSLCGAILEGDDWKWRNNNYCYHCGAKMDGDKSDE